MKKLLSLLTVLLMTVAAQADILCEYSFEGKLNGKIFMELKFAVNHDEIAVGEVYYPKAKHPAPILVVGKILDNGWYFLEEFQPDGEITGAMCFKIVEEENDVPYISEGSWTNVKTDKSYDMVGFRSNGEPIDIPKFFDYEDPQNIGREYSYKLWNPRYNDYMGGTVTFRGAGKHKLHFKVCNAPSNIAEGESEPNRPAELAPYTYNTFEYKDVNECGYSFSAHFFKKFVVLKSTSNNDPSSLNCFGMNVAFDGVYIKTKQ